VTIISTGTVPALAVHDTANYLAMILSRCPAVFPVDVGEVLGIVVGPVPKWGEVLGMPQPGVLTQCCGIELPLNLYVTIIAVQDGVSNLPGSQGVINWITGGNWQGPIFLPSSVQGLVVFNCSNGQFWQLTVFVGGFAVFSVEVVPTCLPVTFTGTFLFQGTTYNAVLVVTAPGKDPTMPAGTIILFAGSSPPAGYLACDGSAVSRTTYANLFAAIGTAWGAGDGSTTFNVPDLRGRSAVGVSPGGLGTDRPTARVLASHGGEETHVLTIPEIAAHTHGSPDGNPFVTYFDTGRALAAGTDIEYFLNDSGSVSTLQTGGGGSHNTMHPFAVALWCIAY
jgi:microcystin-dependent protein